jgi:hypothetical protein
MTWRKVPDSYDTYINPAGSALATARDLDRMESRQQEDAQRQAARARYAEEYRAKLENAPRVSMGGQEYRRDPNNRRQLIGGAALNVIWTDAGLKEYLDRAELDAERLRVRREIAEHANPAKQAERLAALELELAALKGKSRSSK